MKCVMTLEYNKSNISILNEARDYIDGLIISDGNIHCKYARTGYYNQGCLYREWLEFISNDLYEYNIICTIDNGRFLTGGLNSKNGSVRYSLITKSYLEFRTMKDRWYSKYYNVDEYSTRFWHLDEETDEWFIWKKIIPKDIILTPECVLNWYLGDGCISKYKYQNGYRIRLSTDGFSREDIIYLTDILSEVINIKCLISNKQIAIYKQSSIRSFLDYISDLPHPSCYNYKFPELN